MSKEGLSLHQAQEERIAFIEKAVGEGTLSRISVTQRDQNIGIVSTLNQELTEQGIGQLFPKPSGEPLTKQRICQITKAFLRKTYKHASPQLKACYPLRDILARKLYPITEQNALLIQQVKVAIREGITDLRGIEEATGLSGRSISSKRRILEKYGIEIPMLQRYANFATIAEAESDDQKLQTLLESFSAGSLHGHTNRHRQDRERTLTDLSSVLRKGGFYPRPGSLELFAQKLKEKNIPIRLTLAGLGTKTKGKYKQLYYVVYMKHEQRITNALKDDPDLQRFRENPVQLAFGTFNGKLPTTTEVKRLKKHGYANISILVKETLGFRPGGNSITITVLLRNCPIPVFRYGKSKYFFTLSQKTELQTFLRKRHQELQSTNPNSD